MSHTEEYSRLEEKVGQLAGERGTTAQKMKYLDRMDRLWSDMTPEERQRCREE